MRFLLTLLFLLIFLALPLATGFCYVAHWLNSAAIHYQYYDYKPELAR